MKHIILIIALCLPTSISAHDATEGDPVVLWIQPSHPKHGIRCTLYNAEEQAIYDRVYITKTGSTGVPMRVHSIADQVKSASCEYRWK